LIKKFKNVSVADNSLDILFDGETEINGIEVISNSGNKP